jgi:hypothetical protein
MSRKMREQADFSKQWAERGNGFTVNGYLQGGSLVIVAIKLHRRGVYDERGTVSLSNCLIFWETCKK